ncbi:hypothetical protein IMG5_175070 [Ichthyophthirius multifiliis]|uniref:Casein kinase I n=1 Tax=Ichthyophthirius multifiliis TaxID=5932 RepID=G0R251_ICHMU|nr:hypothetical protein IMG5_175070 [Ichthyophthirius multifiliis]EGR28458.1 hypothetical protein IMG5_175070 [Ichthyophthirius multifiliis]|eukprot:XP_004029694.1 hypothetical protein IMG5_175070 [Ichthyophthirius multifiliis]
MSIVELRICGRYKLESKMGNGTFGQIFQAKNIQNNSQVAIKMEYIQSRHPQLLYEGQILQKLQGGIGIPNMHWCGQEGDYNFLVMEMLGQNLQELFVLCGNKFSLKTVLMIADQIINNLEYIHYKTYLHRDLKPENFIIGSLKRQKYIYTIDFGLSKKFRDTKTYEHIPFRDKKPLIGTARYASINSHKGYEQSRRDDLESLAYMLIYFLKGSLPWQGLQCQNREDKYFQILDMKTNYTEEDLCGNLPPEFWIFLSYSKTLKFDEKPDYTYVKKIFKERFVKEGYLFDYVYDWTLIPLKNKNIQYPIKLPLTVQMISNEYKFLKENKDLLDLSKSQIGDTSYQTEVAEGVQGDLDSNYFKQQQEQDNNQETVDKQKQQNVEQQQQIYEQYRQLQQIQQNLQIEQQKKSNTNHKKNNNGDCQVY